MPAGLSMADGNLWGFAAGNEAGRILVGKLAAIMRLSELKPTPERGRMATVRRRISVEALSREVRWAELPRMRRSGVSCRVGPFGRPGRLALQLARVSQVVVSGSEAKGGLLLHGALAERDGRGVILAGPGGVGKSTAVARLPRPWLALSDDASLVVKAPDGAYWAHPWPTWSRIGRGKGEPSWDVQKAVRLKLICMLEQARRDRMHELPYLPALSELVDIAGQAFVILANGLGVAANRRLNLTRFYNAETIAKRVPVLRLQVSRDGRFWKKIEKKLLGRHDVV